jgi:hypothetical protein
MGIIFLVKMINYTKKEYEAVEKELLRENRDPSVIHRRTGVGEELVIELIEKIQDDWKAGYQIHTPKDRNILIRKVKDTEQRLHELRSWIYETQEKIQKDPESLTAMEQSLLTTPLKETMRIHLEIEKLILQTIDKQISLSGVETDNKLLAQDVQETWNLMLPFYKAMVKELQDRQKPNLLEIEQKLLSSDVPPEDTPEYEEWMTSEYTPQQDS